MIKTGVDILRVERIREIFERHNEIKNVFCDSELDYAKTKLENGTEKGVKYYETLAGIFCAKEAVLKALELGIKYKSILKDVEVKHKENGAPFAKLKGEILKEFPIESDISISIAHDGGNAVATAVVEIN